MQSIEQYPLNKGQKVFVRCDLDVPIVNGEIQEMYRLNSLLQTLNYIINKKAFPIIAGHIGKPDGQYDEKLSTKQLLPFFLDKLAGNDFELLENLRFNREEEVNDDSFAKELASKADVFVNESFATSHRAHASIVGVPKYLPHFAGIHFTEEIERLGGLLKNPKKPFTALVGGAKLESKKPVISKLLPIADHVLLGGKLALSWKEEIPQNLVIPEDYKTDQKDIGIKSAEKYGNLIENSSTILWAGPMGVYEENEFIEGTRIVATAISNATINKGAISVIGGGDTIAAVQKIGLLDRFSFVSVGGGAMLQFLVENTLPGIEALN